MLRSVRIECVPIIDRYKERVLYELEKQRTSVGSFQGRSVPAVLMRNILLCRQNEVQETAAPSQLP